MRGILMLPGERGEITIGGVRVDMQGDGVGVSFSRGDFADLN